MDNSYTHTRALLNYLFATYSNPKSKTSPPQPNQPLSLLESSVRKLALAQSRAASASSSSKAPSEVSSSTDDEEGGGGGKSGGSTSSAADDLSEEEKTRIVVRKLEDGSIDEDDMPDALKDTLTTLLYLPEQEHVNLDSHILNLLHRHREDTHPSGNPLPPLSNHGSVTSGSRPSVSRSSSFRRHGTSGALTPGSRTPSNNPNLSSSMSTASSSRSMRENYNTFGVEEYYKNHVQESYRNPHYPALKKCLSQFMDTYIQEEKPNSIKVLDLAAGSGEATEALLSWKLSRWPSSTPSAPSSASIKSSTNPSPLASTSSSSPARPPVQPRPFIPPQAVVRPNRPASTPSIPEPTLSITAADPFTAPAYRQRTGLPCLELSFAQVAAGELPSPSGKSRIESTEEEIEGEMEEEELFDIVIVSFALHLVETSSELWALLTELGKRAKWLCVIAPHKKPDIKSTWGWKRWDPSNNWKAAEGRGNVGGAEGDGFEIVLDRVRLRLWRSEEHWVQEY